MTYYAGLDVSLRSIHICVIGADGEMLQNAKQVPDAPDVIEFLDDVGVDITQVGLEAGTLTQYLTYGLQFAGYDVVCMEARTGQKRVVRDAQQDRQERRTGDCSAAALRLVPAGAYQEHGQPSHPCAARQPQGRARQVR